MSREPPPDVAGALRACIDDIDGDGLISDETLARARVALPAAKALPAVVEALRILEGAVLDYFQNKLSERCIHDGPLADALEQSRAAQAAVRDA